MGRKKQRGSPATAHSATIRLVTDFDHSRPLCDHGPTLLFERLTTGERFFACAAHRHRKGCSFYKKFDDWSKVISRQETARPLVTSSGALSLSKKEIANGTRAPTDRFKQLNELIVAPRARRGFCVNCAKLMTIDSDDGAGCHKDWRHFVRKGLSLNQLQSPSRLLQACTDNRSEAQYYFTSRVIRFIVDTVNERQLTRVICIGTTSIHEFITKRFDSASMRSFLLDIDQRLEQFYLPAQFARFNMFNCHFFEPGGRRSLKSFIKRSSPEQLVIIVDPPFGGLMQPLADTIRKICTLITTIHKLQQSYTVKVLLFMPYFNERIITEQFDNVCMTDYRVLYRNHRKLTSTASTVRLFTNLTDLKLPLTNYRLCKDCKRYVHVSNVHCSKCNCCTSSGRLMIHCDACGCCRSSNHVHRDNVQ